jgi:flagellin-like hook-associated protein FlgL
MMVYNSLVKNLAKGAERTQEIQEVITSGKRINRLSDDPVGVSKVVNYETHLNKLGQYRENITYGNSWLNMSDSVLLDMQNLVTEAKTIAIAQSTETATPETRAQAAVAVRNLYEQLIAFANTKLGDSYIFGGSLTNIAPFNSDGTYNGNADDILIEIMEGIKSKINVAGSEFLITDLNPALSFDPINPETAGSTSSAGLVARNSNTVVGDPLDPLATSVENLSNYRVTFVLNNGMTQEITYTTDGDATQAELGAGIADAVNSHDVLNQHIRATYDPSGEITFEAKVEAAVLTTAFTGGSSEIPAGALFDVVAGENDEFSIAIDGIDSGPLTIAAGTYTVAQLVTEIQSVIGGSATVAFEATIGQFTITSNSTGIGSTVILTNGTNDFLQTVGLDRDFAVAGTSPTLLADLNGRNGVATGTIRIYDRAGNPPVDVAVDATETIEDVINNISAVPNITATLNERNGITITDSSGFPIQNLVIEDNATARDLGIVGDKPGPIYGTDLNPAVTDTTRIDALNGGSGLTLGTIRVVNGQQNEIIDLSRAESIGDVVTALNDLGMDITASINSSGTALDVLSDSSDFAAVVNDMGEGTTASDLGIQGAADVFKTLAVLEEALEKNDQTALLNMLDQFDLVLETLVEKGSEVGVRTNKLEVMNNRINVSEVEISGLKSEIEDADMIEYLTKFTLQQTALEAIMTTAGQSIQLSLLNFLR